MIWGVADVPLFLKFLGFGVFYALILYDKVR